MAMLRPVEPHRIVRLENPIRPYAWGSTTAIAELLGRPSTGTPQAELWIGAHPASPSHLTQTDVALDEWIARHPEAILGVEVAEQYAKKLPFLLKVLAAAQPLSIQCHPDRSQAQAGFLRENDAGIPLDAPHRNYKDDNHKPELLSALTPFVALSGFRPVHEILSLTDRLQPELSSDPLAALRAEPNKEGLKAAYRHLMTAPAQDRAQWAHAAARAAEHAPQDEPAYVWIAELARRYPDDIGVWSPLLLNLIALNPGEALYLGAGMLHAYLEGTGIEIMANSDNVLRGGLTPKHVDVPELLRVLTFDAGSPEVLRPDARGVEAFYDTPTPEFRLGIITLDGHETYEKTDRNRVEILLCVYGQIILHTDDAYPLKKGQTCLIPALVPNYQLSGSGQIFVATVP